jgi:uncharacterized repeat protein (TIGR01451 family)
LVTGGLIPVGESYSGTFTAFLASDSLKPHYNVTTAVGTDDDGTTDTATDDETVTFDDVAPDIQVTKTADPTHVPETGGTVTFTILVENIGVEDVTLTSLTDSVFGDLNGQGTLVTGGLIPVGESYSGTFTAFLASDSLKPHYNVTTAVGTDDDGTTDTETDDETVTFDDVKPLIAITKEPSPLEVPETGGEVTFTFVITNTGVEEETVTYLYDDKLGNLLAAAKLQNGGNDIVLAPGGEFTFSVKKTLESDLLIDHINTIDVTAVDDDNSEATATATATVTFSDVAPVIEVTKTANPTSVPETGGDVTFTITVKNIGTEPVTLIGAVDTVFGTIDVSLFDKQYLKVGEVATYLFTEWIDGDYEGGIPHHNVVTVTAEDNEGTEDSDDDEEDVNFTDVTADIDVEKEVRVSYGGDSWSDWADADDPTGPIVVEGYLVEFRFTVTNNSPVTLNNFSLTDNVYSLAGIVIPTSLESGETVKYIIQTTAVLGQHTNTATASGSFTDGVGNTETGTDTDDANYYGISKGQPSIQIEYLMISASSVSDTASGSFRITDQSTAAKVPDGALIVLKDFGLDWTTKAKKAKVYTDIEATGCTFWVVSKEGLVLDVPEQIIPGVPYIFDEEIIIEYECTFADKVLVKGASLKGTAWATIYGRPEMTFTYSSTTIVQ